MIHLQLKLISASCLFSVQRSVRKAAGTGASAWLQESAAVRRDGWVAPAILVSEDQALSYASMHFTSTASFVSLLPLPILQILFSFGWAFAGSVLTDTSLRFQSVKQQNDINHMRASARGRFSAQRFSRCDKTQTWKHFLGDLQSLTSFSGFKHN